jgi:hypothetical protein
MNIDLTPIVVIFLGSMVIFCIALGCTEIVVYCRLKMHARRVTGQVTSAFILSDRLHSYGEVGFTYQVGGVFYHKNQTVPKKTAQALLPLPSKRAISRGASKKEVTVLFLPQNPSIARLLITPRDHERMCLFIVMLVSLGAFALAILFPLLFKRM